MSGPKSSYYDVTAEQRRRLAEERRRREEAERLRRIEEERRRREEMERQRRIEEERRRREEEERKRREEEARQARIKQADNVIDDAFANFKTISVNTAPESTEKIAEQNNFTGEEFLNRLKNFAVDSRLSADLISKIDETRKIFEDITDAKYRKNLVALKVNPLLKECEKFLKLYEKTSDLRIEYQTVCEMANEPEKNFGTSESEIENMQSEINRLREKIARDDEKNYIHKCLDEVMTEMGYDVIGRREVTKKSGKHFENKLFSYADGTAVNVTFAEDGRIAMELCGLDDTDRTPEVEESEKLCEQMESFCDDFGEIEKRLAEKGVIIRNRIQRLPPSTEYAQILNFSDYKMTGEVEKFTAKRRENISKKLQRKI